MCVRVPIRHRISRHTEQVFRASVVLLQKFLPFCGLRRRNPLENDVICASNTLKFLIMSFRWLQGQAR